jgi:hypothetical protein
MCSRKQRRIVSLKYIDVSVTHAASIRRTMKSVYFNETTRRCVTKRCHLQCLILINGRAIAHAAEYKYYLNLIGLYPFPNLNNIRM